MILSPNVKRTLSPLWTQLGTNSGTEGEDCGALAVINLVLWASRGKIGPKAKGDVGPWVRQIRRWTSNKTGPMFILGDCFQALNHPELTKRFRAAGVKPPDVAYAYGKPFGDVREYLARSTNHAVLLPFDYGVARADGAPMGSTTFNDAHAVMMVGAQRRRTKVGARYRMRWFTLLGDSLMDGRDRPGGGDYPKGWILARLYRYRRAAGAFGTAPDGSPRPIGFGRTVVISVTRD